MFDRIEQARVEELHLKSAPSAQLRAIIAIHSTRLGPALGGCRCIDYVDADAAINDAIRLARGMSYKAALAGVPQGGGKAVIIKPPHIDDRIALYHAFGHFVAELGGRYITAVDSGSSLTDMDQVARITPYVSGTGQDGLNPSPITALGVFAGIQSAARHALQRDDLSGIRVAIQGVGQVGMALATLLAEAGAQLLVSDTDPARMQRCAQTLHAEPVAPEQIIDAECDVFAPCALGGVVNDTNLPRFNCAIIAGAANNQLAEDRHGERLHARGILYAPDYVINAGGLINVSLGYLKVPPQAIQARTLDIGTTLDSLFQRSHDDNVAPGRIADQMAEAILYQ